MTKQVFFTSDEVSFKVDGKRRTGSILQGNGREYTIAVYRDGAPFTNANLEFFRLKCNDITLIRRNWQR